MQGEEDGEAMAQATAQIAQAAATSAAASPTALPANASHVQQVAPSVPQPDGHDFESAASTPDHIIPVTGADISLPYVLRSADDLKTPYSNYTSGYKELLDYVW